MIDQISRALIRARAPYRIIDKTFVPVGSTEEAATISEAFDNLRSDKRFLGANQHLRNAAEACTAGDFAGSIHAVESVARTLSPGARALSPALAELEKHKEPHGGMRKGFEALYGFASDEKGIRHPLLDGGAANVDETDAIFMLGACAALVSYLVKKSSAVKASE